MNDRDRTIAWLLAAFCLILAATFAQCALERARASAGPLPSSEWTPAARTNLVRCALVEGGNRRDTVAIAYVLARRWRLQRQGWTFAEQTRRYSRPLRVGARSEHQKRALSTTWETAPRALRETLSRWYEGREPDPCPGAYHWGAPSIEHDPALLLRCGTANYFFRRPT